MAGLEELKKKLEPLFDAEKGLSFGTVMDPSESYMVSTSSIPIYMHNQILYQLTN